jgi:hypothetical protein
MVSGVVLRHTQPEPHRCAPPWRLWWRRLGVGAQWRCECGETFEVQARWMYQAQAGNEVWRTEWVRIGGAAS